MTRSKPATFIVLLFGALLPACKAQIAEVQSRIAGTWRGNSECVVKNSACRDEVNVYRFSEISGRLGWFSGAGSKVVDGREISMGTLDWRYDGKSHVLESDSSNGVFRLVVDDDRIEGTLALPDGTIYRRIHLGRAK